MSVVVSDTSPLHYLILCGVDPILSQLFDQVVIPPTVFAELQHSDTPAPVQEWMRTLPAWVAVRTPTSFDDSLDVDAGEREAICLAREIGAAAVLMDDRAGRHAAAQCGLAAIGTVGLLEQAAALGWIDLPHTIERLQETNARVDQKLVDALLHRHAARNLTDKQFLEVIERTPLVSIDLITRDQLNRILLGRRVNEPAKGKWFVPGGRIHKDKTLEAAFRSICVAEIEEVHSLSEARFVGSFTHKYPTNFFLVEGITTHYVVLAFELRVAATFKKPKTTADNPKAQHSEFIWFTQEAADPEFNGADPDVHENVLPYFRDASQMTGDQYQLLNARRDNFNTLFWQTPVLSLTAQAFLFTIIFSKEVTEPRRTFASVLAMIVALGSVQLLSKHRFNEEEHAKFLHSYESAHKKYAANRKLRPANRFVRIPSYLVWMIVLLAFLFVAVGSFAVSLCNWLHAQYFVPNY